ncbi:MAG: winged helix-turn-helix transcriptional regulator [Thermoplasmatota archaeon]
MRKLDEKDKEILKILKDNSRIPFTKIAEKIDMSEATVRNRIAKLEEEGIIERYTIDIDPYKMGYNTVTLLGLDVEPEYFLKTMELLKEIEEIRWVAQSTGDHMIMAEIWTKNGRALSELMSNKIGKIEGVKRLCPSILLNKG